MLTLRLDLEAFHQLGVYPQVELFGTHGDDLRSRGRSNFKQPVPDIV